jgi:U3 small nucleolar ribonucleoprotein protein LCP5
LNDFSNLAGIHQVEQEENERFRNVLERKKQKAESGYNKRSREDDDDGDDDLPTGKSVNKFQKARKRKARGKKH